MFFQTRWNKHSPQQKPCSESYEVSESGPQAIEAVMVKGRRYLRGDGTTYVLPKDLEDVHRLDFQHVMLKQALPGNYRAPLSEHIRKILDLGCGTGRWCEEMAQEYPAAQVIGLDLEESLPTEHQRPANYCFTQANVLKPLPFPNNTFDYIHQRLMLLSIPTDSWPQVLREMVRVAQVGSWVELVEIGCTIWPQGPVTQRWYGWLRTLGQALNRDVDLPPRLASLAFEAGFRQVLSSRVDIPLGWGGQVGITSLLAFYGFYQAIKHALLTSVQLDPHRVDLIWKQLMFEWREQQASLRYTVVCAQK